MDISRKTFILTILGLILLRILLVVLVMNNIPFTGMTAGGFRPTFTESYQPDELQYFKLTEGLIAGRSEKLVPNIGASLIFAPFIYFTGASLPDELAKSVFIFEAFVLFSLALILVVLIAEKLFNSRKLAVISVALFSVYPWVLLLIFNLAGYKNAIPAFHYQLWIFILSDYLSAFLVYLGFFLIFKWFKNIFESLAINWQELIIIAVVSGAAILTRMGNFWLILIIFSTLTLSFHLHSQNRISLLSSFKATISISLSLCHHLPIFDNFNILTISSFGARNCQLPGLKASFVLSLSHFITWS